jgi:deoxyhypusine synthase
LNKNIISVIYRYLCEHKMIDCLVSSAGGVEEDFIKCLGSFYVGIIEKYLMIVF